VEKQDIFRDIAERTGGDIYLGVVGPARSAVRPLFGAYGPSGHPPNIGNPKKRDPSARD
jgi:stage IV sporulation protein A